MLIDETELASRLVPELLETFSRKSLMELERSDGKALADLFREQAQPGFLVPRDLGGMGGSLLELAQVLRLVGARCPSLAIMMTMHHHAVGAFARGGISMPFRETLVRRVATERALVATAFAEGRPGADILDSTVECTWLEGGEGCVIRGSKRPCCMSPHADFAIVGVAVGLAGDGKGRGLALVDRRFDGVRSEPSWPGELLAATDSHSLVFDGVRVPAAQMLAPRSGGGEAMMDRLAVVHAEMALSCLFQLTVSASYLGIASRLCEMVLQRKAGSRGRRLRVLGRVEGAALSLYRLAQMLDEGDFSGYLLARSMVVAHNASRQSGDAVTESVKALGGAVFLSSPEVQYLLLASRCVDFHPPNEPLREEIVDSFYGDLV